MCNAGNNCRFVDCAIPCNNKSGKAVGTIFWTLVGEILKMKNEMKRHEKWYEDWFKELPFFWDQKIQNDETEQKQLQEEVEQKKISNSGYQVLYLEKPFVEYRNFVSKWH